MPERSGHRDLFRQMARARAFEDALGALWREGLVSGEMHLGTGEEGVAAGVAASLRAGDAVALDHRPTPVLTVRFQAVEAAPSEDAYGGVVAANQAVRRVLEETAAWCAGLAGGRPLSRSTSGPPRDLVRSPRRSPAGAFRLPGVARTESRRSRG